MAASRRGVFFFFFFAPSFFFFLAPFLHERNLHMFVPLTLRYHHGNPYLRQDGGGVERASRK